jgi:hypothetical protein
MDGQAVIHDIRMLDWKFKDVQQLDHRFLEDSQKPIVAFNIHEKSINMNIVGDNERRSLLLRMSMTPEIINEANENTQEFIVQQC